MKNTAKVLKEKECMCVGGVFRVCVYIVSAEGEQLWCIRGWGGMGGGHWWWGDVPTNE
jgi:hypothetical protein